MTFPDHLRPQRGAAVHHDILQSDMAGGIGGKEQHGTGNLLRTGDFAKRNTKLELLAKTANALLLCIVVRPQGPLHIGVR